MTQTWTQHDDKDLWALQADELSLLPGMTALSPLTYHHVNPYGRIDLDMDMSRRLLFAA